MKQQGTLKTVFSFAAETRGKMVLSVILAIVSAFAGLVPYLCAYQIIILFFAEAQTIAAILFWSSIALASHAIRLLFYGMSTTLSHIAAYNILKNMRMRIAQRLMRAPLGTVLNQTAGKLKNIIVDHVETIELPLAHLIPEGISYLLIPVAAFIFLCTIDWRMALAALITVPIAGLAYAHIMRTFNQKYAQFMKASDQVNGVIVEYVEGIEVIKAFNQSGASYAKYSNAIKAFKEYTLDWYRSTWKMMNFGGAVLPSTLLGSLPIGMYLNLTGSLTPADLTISLILSLGIVGPLTAFSMFVNQYKAIEFAISSARELLELEELPVQTRPVALTRYDISLRNVSFSYETQKEQKQQNQILHSISADLPAGSFTALVGPSGGGKSTVARLIARFWDVSLGEIQIGGVDIRQIPLTELADTISFVTQDNFLFNCSLMENIRLGNPQAADEQVIAAARAACCDEFIRALEHGYQTTAGEAGDKLSGGERQRLAIARAILKDAPIVILDEATAFTDPENEDKIQQSITALTKGKTLLVIAHRLSTVKHADQIIVMEDGRVNRSGSHEELLENCALYQRMWYSHIGARQWAAGSSVQMKEGGMADV